MHPLLLMSMSVTFVAVSKIEITSSILTTSDRRMPVKIHGTELRLFLVRSSYFYYSRQNSVLFSVWIEPCTNLTLGLFIKCTPQKRQPMESDNHVF